MDAETRKHFDNWVASYFCPEQQAIITSTLLLVYEHDPEYYQREGWNKLLRDAEAEFGQFW